MCQAPKLVKSVTKESRLSGQEYRGLWSQKLLQPKALPPFKPPRVSVKPKRRVKPVNWVLPGLYSIAQFLRGQSPEGPPCDVIERLPETNAVYIIGTTLHVHPIRLRFKDELNLILLATQFRVINEVRIHNIHLNFFITARRAHVRINQTYWRTVEWVLLYVVRGPWVEKDSKKERAVRVTFDEVLKPAVTAWKVGLPYEHLVFDIPEYEIDLISTWTNLPSVHLHISPFVVGWSSDSDQEVDVVNDTLDKSEEEGDEILMALGYPFFAL